jgi:hypothetical protein
MKMKRPLGRHTLVIALAVILLLAFSALPALAAPVEKDTAGGAEDSYMYGGNADEIIEFNPEIATATGDVNGDGVPDLIIGHDKGDDFYSGKVYVLYGQTNIAPDIDLGTNSDVTINGYWGSTLGNAVTCGDINGDNIDDIIMGAYQDDLFTPTLKGGVAVIFGSNSLPSSWDFQTTDPDLYLSRRDVWHEYCFGRYRWRWV